MVADRLRILIATGLLAGVAGCGQKGPLYLPDKGGEVVTRPAGQQAPQPQPPQTAPQPSPQPQPNQTDREEKKDQPR